MGFNKRYISEKHSLIALKNNDLSGYYGRADMLIFETDLCDNIYELYQSGKSEQEIINIINLNTEVNYEVR